MLLPRRTGWLWVVALVVLLSGPGCIQQARPQIEMESREFKQKIADYLMDLNSSIDDVEVDKIEPLEESPFVAVTVSVKVGNRDQETELFVTEDGNHLIIGQVWDLNLSPQIARWQRLRKEGQENLERIDLSDRPVKGNPEAKVVVVEFSDYQCPYCAKANSGLEKQLLDQYGDRIQLVFKHLPLIGIHPWALKASIAAACGYLQDPPAFWGIHDQLFENQKKITVENLRSQVEGFAQETGLNLEEFLDCFDNERTKSVVQEDLREARRLKITSTPTFLLNGAPFRGAPDFDEFSGFIDMALEEASEE